MNNQEILQKIVAYIEAIMVDKSMTSRCNLRRAAATGAFASGHPAEPNGHLH